MRIGYLAPEGLETQLALELGKGVERQGRLFLTDKGPVPHWVQNIWYRPERIAFLSIKEAADILRAQQRSWALYHWLHHRRAALIEERLPPIHRKPRPFPTPLPHQPLGSWTLLDPNTLLASADCSSPFPNGELVFEECKEGPPGRAYLKLWELFTLCQKKPAPGERCLEVGASPGSWSWVLQQCGAQVLAVDRAPLDPSLMHLPGLQFQRGDGFAMTPDKVGAIDWLFSDLVCYPEKLFSFVQLWLDSGLCRHFVCTLKFQGKGGYAIADQFAAIPGSHLRHLSHNKHELTWTKFSP